MTRLGSFSCGRTFPTPPDRRTFLRQAGAGCGLVALADLLHGQGLLAADETPAGPLTARPPHFRARALSVIWLFMEGGPSAVDLFDPKPELQKRHGQRIPVETFFGNPGPLLRSPFSFRQFGQSGAWVCDRLPRLAGCIDELAFIKSLRTESNNHAPAMAAMNTGMSRPGFPSTGSWVTYGLGSDNQNLPGFVVLGNNRGSKGGPINWSAGFLPAAYQGTPFRAQGTPVLNLDRPTDVSADDQRAQLDLLARLNRQHQERHPGEADLEARIQSFELAHRMQSEAHDAVAVDREPEEIKRLYGLDVPASRGFGRKCLLARRLVERGVRFVQVYCDNEWDAHGNLVENHTSMCAQTDGPIAGLLTDLKRSGLLDSTLVIWAGEFGRMPVSEGGTGRDHNPHGFLAWLAGGGVKGGTSHGETDEFGLKATKDVTTLPDLHATILHLLGLDHTRLTYLHNGRRFRLTDVSGEVVKKVLA